MKNANDAQRRALRERASRLRLPPLERGPDGHLAPQSLTLVRERALRIARENHAVVHYGAADIGKICHGEPPISINIHAEHVVRARTAIRNGPAQKHGVLHAYCAIPINIAGQGKRRCARGYYGKRDKRRNGSFKLHHSFPSEIIWQRSTASATPTLPSEFISAAANAAPLSCA